MDGASADSSRTRVPVRLIGVLLTVAAAAGLWWLLWSPFAATQQRFDRGRNGLWVGHQWYTGRNVRSGDPVGEEERSRFVTTLRAQRIHYAFVHVGPLLPDGSTADRADPSFAELRDRTPDTLYLAWLGGIESRLAVGDPGWRQAVVATVQRLRDEGFAGLHLNIEPLHDHHTGYLELLHELRDRLGEGFLLSHATRQAGPFGIAVGPMVSQFWSEEFYRSTMKLVDQTVLMAYDTKSDVAKHYVAFVKHQTELLVEWACQIPGHRVLIGIPSYEDVPLYSNPEVENIPSAVSGVRAALEEVGPSTDCFEGVSVYANWVTDAEEWEDFRLLWLDTDPGFR